MVEKLKDPAQRLWYAAKAVEAGWSRAVLVHQIEGDLYARQGKALTNFARTLPAPQSDLAGQLLKDEYNFGFLALAADARERHLEAGLLDHLRRFLLELGVGFAFVGSLRWTPLSRPKSGGPSLLFRQAVLAPTPYTSAGVR